MAWAIVQVSSREARLLLAFLVAWSREVVYKGDAKVLPGFDGGELVTMDGIRASYLSPLFADPDDLILQWVEGQLPVFFLGL